MKDYCCNVIAPCKYPVKKLKRLVSVKKMEQGPPKSRLA